MTAQQVERWLAEGGRLAGCRVIGPLTVRQNSRLFHAECSVPHGALAVKICLRPHTSEVDAHAARSQYETLQRVHRAMGGGSELSVPEPYLLMPHAGLVASEWIPGENMAALLFSWRCSGARARGFAARAGQWLRRFHASHAAGSGYLDVLQKLEIIERMQDSNALPQQPLAEALACLRASAGAAAAVALERSWVHGDFTADNLMVAGRRTVGIDVDIRFENSVIHDLAPFLNHLELRAFHPGGWRRLPWFEDLQRTFLEGYGSGAKIGVPLAWLRLCMVLQGWATARRQASSRLRARFADFSYRTVTAGLVRALARPATARAS